MRDACRSRSRVMPRLVFLLLHLWRLAGLPRRTCGPSPSSLFLPCTGRWCETAPNPLLASALLTITSASLRDRCGLRLSSLWRKTELLQFHCKLVKTNARPRRNQYKPMQSQYKPMQINPKPRGRRVRTKIGWETSSILAIEAVNSAEERPSPIYSVVFGAIGY